MCVLNVFGTRCVAICYNTLLGLSNTYRRGETLRGYRDNYVKCNMAVFFFFLQICLRAVQPHANHKTGRRSTNYTRWRRGGEGSGGRGETCIPVRTQQARREDKLIFK